MPQPVAAPKPDLVNCIRCGHPKAEHYPVVSTMAPDPVLICPSSTFLLDTLQADMDAA